MIVFAARRIRGLAAIAIVVACTWTGKQDIAVGPGYVWYNPAGVWHSGRRSRLRRTPEERSPTRATKPSRPGSGRRAREITSGCFRRAKPPASPENS